MTVMSDDTPSLPWFLAVEAVPERGGPVTHIATEAERAAVIAALSLETLTDLRFAGRIERLAGGRYRLIGRVTAALEQACVVTLDPVGAKLNEPLDVEFRPADMVTKVDQIDVELDEASEIEPIERGKLAIGRVVYETFAAGLDPYPRKSGEAIDEMLAAPKGADTSKVNPFAVLAKFKPKGSE